MGIVFAQIMEHFWNSLERGYRPHKGMSHYFTLKVQSLVVSPSFPCHSPDLHPGLPCFLSHISWLFMSLWANLASLWTPLESTNNNCMRTKANFPYNSAQIKDPTEWFFSISQIIFWTQFVWMSPGFLNITGFFPAASFPMVCPPREVI